MQRKISNIKYKLHSIPILLNMKNKSNVPYSIPCGCILAFLLVAMTGLILHQDCHAATTATLKLGTSSLNSTTVQGETVYLNSTISATTTDTESYVLTVTGPTNLTGATTITGAGGKTGSTMSNNTWGYSYNQTGDNSNKTYISFTGAAQTLESGTIANGSTKNITFAARFADDAVAGHYTAKVMVGLVATPKKIVFNGITTMQEMTSVICSNAEVGDLATLTDDRTYPSNVSKTYTIRKMEDGKCWMTQNLRLTGSSLTSSNSNISSNYTIPTSNISSFNTTTTTQAAYYHPATDTAYYTWCAATANTCGSFTTDGANSTYNICPKGWTLPTGGTGTSTNFRNLFTSMGLSITSSLQTTTGSVNWGTGDLDIVQGPKYNFAYTGYVYNGSFTGGSAGCWWSRMSINSSRVYLLYITRSYVHPGTYSDDRYRGLAVRCVADTGGYDTAPTAE